MTVALNRRRRTANWWRTKCAVLGSPKFPHNKTLFVMKNELELAMTEKTDAFSLRYFQSILENTTPISTNPHTLSYLNIVLKKNIVIR